MQRFWHNDGLTIVEPSASITMFGRILFISRPSGGSGKSNGLRQHEGGGS